MTDKTQEFLELLERIKNRGDNIDKIMEEMHEMLPAVEKNVLRDAAKICSLGFDPFILVQTADFVAVANGDEDKKLEYRARELEKEIDLFHKLDLFPENNEEDSETCFFYFKDEFHERILQMLFPDEKMPEKICVPISDLFFVYGSTLIDLGDVDGAENALHAAVTWNLTDAATTFEYAESLKMQGDMEHFFVKTLSAWQISFTKEDVARVFRNLAFFFAEQKDWQNANINLALSSIYEHDEKKILRELEYIQENADVELEEVTQEMIEEYAKELELPIGPNPEILTLLDSYCSELHERGDYVKSLPYLQNLYDLTGEPEVKKIIKEIKSGKLKGKK